MKRSGLWLLVALMPILFMAMARVSRVEIDLSTPQNSYATFVDILKAGRTSALPQVATQTGLASLVALYQLDAYKEGMGALGKELSTATPHWEEITEDIYFAKATVDGRVHKMEFTKEEPGWMLYHWQIGGGADAHGTESKTEPQD